MLSDAYLISRVRGLLYQAEGRDDARPGLQQLNWFREIRLEEVGEREPASDRA